MHSQDSAQIAQALFDAFNAHDLDRLEALTSDGFLGIGPDSPDLRMGRRGGRAWASAYFTGFPDSKWTKERIFGQGTAFVLQGIYTGTRAGAFGGAERSPATHNAGSVPATFVGVGRFVIEVFLVPLVGRVQEPHDLRRLDVPDLWHFLQVLLGGREHGADGSEALEEAAGERLADARQSLDDEPLPLL